MSVHANHENMRSLGRSHSCHGASRVISSGTNTSSNTTSHEPVPRIDTVSQVSTNDSPCASRGRANSSRPAFSAPTTLAVP